ncbi:MAG TPA: MupA/Atu3671 family FMN-dependent luciferase-like monooxygenase, partial [Pyrinomonadaceae bacterium]
MDQPPSDSTLSAEETRDDALSHGQQALWFLHRLAPESAAYNLAGAIRLVSEVNVAALHDSFQALVDRHPSLRTTYHEQDGRPVRRVHDRVPVSFEEENASAWTNAELDDRLAHDALIPFDLENGPVLRVSLFTHSADEHVLLLVVHHLAVDFWSLAVLLHELGVLYQARVIGTPAAFEPLPLQYSDYVTRQQQMLRSAEGERLWTYWQKQLAGELPVLDLHTDRPRPSVQTFAGASHAFRIDPALTRRLKVVARERGATLYMLLLASFQILLHRYTQQEDILVGSPAAGRGRADLAGLVGYFVNPLVLRADFSVKPTVDEFLDQVRRTVLDAYRHQDYPFALLVEKLQPERDAARSPLFQVLFTFQQSHLRDEEDLAQFALGEAGAQMNVGGLRLESMALEQRVAQFDVTLMMAEASDGLAASLQYNRDLFDARTIERMARHYENLLASLVDAESTTLVRELEWLSAGEREEIVYGWNETEVVVESELSIAEEIGVRALELDREVALVSGREEVSYAELNARANRLGRYLRRLGVGPEVVVGVCLERSVELVVGLLGVLKAGGAYLPLDPSYPRERLEWMLVDAGVQVVVSEETLRTVLGEFDGRVVCVDVEGDLIARESSDDLVDLVSDENLAYVIYTSGSTGRPKGVMVQQGNVKNFFRGMDDSLTRREVKDQRPVDGQRETWLAVTSVSFDISVLELLWSLRRGCRVVLQSEVGQRGAYHDLDHESALPLGAPITSSLERELAHDRGQRIEHELARESGSAEGEETEARELDFSLFYFAATSASNGNNTNGHGSNGTNGTSRNSESSVSRGSGGRDRYRLLLEGARYADEHGYKAVWTPERHFHEFGGLYPNPSITSAALATITERVELRAGSVVLPLHNPVRVAEEWSVIDNLSGGRVGVSFASGWHADDFVLAPEHYARRQQVMEEGIALVRQLWRGEGVRLTGGSGSEVEVRIEPRPLQRELPVWVTAAGAVETFRQAGRLGAGVLTHLLGQSVEDLEAKIAAYRAAWRKAGHAGRGQVTLMLHTFVGSEEAAVKREVRAPMLQYLGSSLGLIERLAKSLGKDLGGAQLSGADYDEVLEYAFERYYEKSGLLGTVEKCVAMVGRLRRIGIDEVACLIDFGPGVELVLESLQYLEEVRRRSRLEALAAQKRAERSITIGEQLRRQEVTHLQCTPTLAGALLQEAETRAGLSKLEQLLCGGEALPGSLAAELSRTVRGNVHNMYGPTETTIWSAVHEVVEADGETPIVALGRPIANTQLYLLDDALKPVPIGVRGELYIGGDGVARGYWNRGELTAERFVPDPFSRRGGERLYRTGDEGRYLPSGEIEYLGRSDQQVKLRGYRIELGEIEAALREHENVSNAAVAIRGERLVAYVVPTGDLRDLKEEISVAHAPIPSSPSRSATPANVSAGELRAHLQQRLPDYMVPSYYVTLTALPQTPNGKLDRKSLPEPDAAAGLAATTYEAPRTPVEEVLAAIIAEVLQVPRVGRHDDFFALGGHSLLAMQVISRIREAFQVELPVRVLFET